MLTEPAAKTSAKFLRGPGGKKGGVIACAMADRIAYALVRNSEHRSVCPMRTHLLDATYSQPARGSCFCHRSGGQNPR